MTYSNCISRHVDNYKLTDIEHLAVLTIIKNMKNKLTGITMDNADVFTEIIVRSVKKLEVLNWTISQIFQYATTSKKDVRINDLKDLIQDKNKHDLSLFYCDAISTLN